MYNEAESQAQEYFNILDSIFWREGKGERYIYDYRLAKIILNLRETLIEERECEGVKPTRLYQCRDGSILTVTADRLILN